MREQLFHLSGHPETTLQAQLREQLVSAILAGHIRPGGPVPSSRRLARQLGVSRNTVTLAYQHLVDDGYLVARERSGYYVSADVLAGRAPAPPRPCAATAPPDWQRRLHLRPAAQRNIAKPRNWHRYPYPFIYGQVDPALFPLAEWRECCREALSLAAMQGWARDRVDGDDPLLIEELRTRVLPRRGVWARPEEILVTVGAQQALYLLARLLVGASDTVGVEDPGYVDARNIFAIQTRRLRPLAVDADGLVVDARLGGCRYVYATPSHQSPTTVTMSLARRRALLDAAARHDLVIVEDDYESETNFVGEPTPALKSLDANERVIYVGSLSKTLAPGLRLGFMVAPAELIREARALRRLMLRHPPANNQRTVALFLARGCHDSLVRRLSHAYRERWQAMGRSLARHLPESARAPTFGGTSYWVRGPAGLDARALARRAMARGILIEPGDVHFMGGASAPRNCFRLGFSSIPVDRIEPGIRELARLVHRMGGRAGRGRSDGELA